MTPESSDHTSNDTQYSVPETPELLAREEPQGALLQVAHDQKLNSDPTGSQEVQKERCRVPGGPSPGLGRTGGILGLGGCAWKAWVCWGQRKEGWGKVCEPPSRTLCDYRGRTRFWRRRI